MAVVFRLAVICRLLLLLLGVEWRVAGEEGLYFRDRWLASFLRKPSISRLHTAS